VPGPRRVGGTPGGSVASWTRPHPSRPGAGPPGVEPILLPDRAPDANASAVVASDDAALVARVLGGERDAFRLLVERESRTVVRACYRILGDLHEAEDAAQEAFVTAFRALATWRADGPFGAWLTRIAVRIALRMAGKRRSVAWIDPAEPDALAGSYSDPAVDRSAAEDPARRAMRAEQEARVRAAVAALDEPYREVVALRFFGELSLAEIATQTERPLGTVKTHLHRGLARLRRDLDSEDLR
jgi:RNA polymerase sigma-70 factor (ECF subfamily)